MYKMQATLLLIFFGGVAQAKVPAWAAKDSHKLVGSRLITVCTGTGPSVDIARKEALNSCRSAAKDQLVTNIKIRSLTIQTEKSVGFHEEISEGTEYTGLICKPEKDELEEREGSFTVWMRCAFDLSKVKAIPVGQESEEAKSNGGDSIENRESLAELEISKAANQAKDIFSEKRTLIVSVVPRCESLLVRGEKSRALACDENPVTVLLDPADKEILVRAKGYKPKTIKLGKEKKNHEAIQVVLDLL